MAIVSTTSSSVQDIKFVSTADIPKLELWLDAADASTIQADSFFDDDAYNLTPAYYNVANVITLDGDFTIETWIYKTATQYSFLVSGDTSSGSSPRHCYFGYDYSGVTPRDGKLILSLWSSNYYIETTNQPLTALHTWYHVAVTRSGSEIAFFVDGKLQPSAVRSSSVASTVPFYVKTFGRWADGSSYVVGGFASNMRVVKGKALYTSDFNIPTVPLNSQSGLGFTTEVLTFQDLSPINNANPSNSFTVYGTQNIIPTSALILNCWENKGSLQLSAIQTTWNQKPLYVLQEVNGLNAVDFDGVNDFLNLSGSLVTTNENWSHVFVYRRLTNSSYSASLGKAAYDESTFLHWTNDYIHSGSRRTDTTILSTGVNVGVVSKNTQMVLNGKELPFNVGWGSSSTIANQLGKYHAGYYHKDLICEVIHMRFQAPLYELQRISNVLTTKWKIPTVPPYIRTIPIISVVSSTNINTTNGEWYAMDSGGSSYSLQWQNSTNNSTWNDIPSQTTANLTVNGSYKDQYIRSKVIATNIKGASNPTYSNVLQLTTVNIAEQTISIASNTTITTTNGDWTSTMPITGYRHRWESSVDNSTWNDIPSQTTSTLNVTSLYNNQYIRSKVAAITIIGDSNPVFSNVLYLTAANTVAPVISWVASDSTTITTTNGNWTSTMPITSTTYQWVTSPDGVNWTTTPFVSASQDFFDYSYTYVKSIVTIRTSANSVSAESNVIFTNNVQQHMLNYIAAVEAADGASLELAVKEAIRQFVTGCKQDGIWDAITGCCLMAGPRTVPGALVPLKGPAPTQPTPVTASNDIYSKKNFVEADYNRKTGLKGDLYKYLFTNINMQDASYPNDHHISTYITDFIGGNWTSGLMTNGGERQQYLMSNGSIYMLPYQLSSFNIIYYRSASTLRLEGSGASTNSYLQLRGISRKNSSGFDVFQNGAITYVSRTRTDDVIPFPRPLLIFANPDSETDSIDGRFRSRSRLSWYSAGRSIDLTKLNSRLDIYMNTLNSAI